MKIDKVKGKMIYFIDRNGAWRISKATAIHGNTITVTDAVGGKERLHPETSKIFGIAGKTINNVLQYEPIEYGIIRIGKRIKNKKIRKDINAIPIKVLKTKRPRAGRPKKVK